MTLAFDYVTFDESAPRHHALTLALGLLYGTAASLLATLLVSLVVTRTRMSDLRERAQSLVGILGISTDRAFVGRLAIVLPAFPTEAELPGDEPTTSSTSTAGPARPETEAEHYRHYIERTTGLPTASILSKRPADMGRFGYSRRDLLLVMDLIRLASMAGMPQPIIVSDIDFLLALDKSSEDDDLIYLPVGNSDVNSLELITSVVSIGLWSNNLTSLMSDSEAVPFRLAGDGAGRTIKLRHDGGRATGALDDTDSDQLALFARYTFPQQVVTVLGGIRSIGTARMGDLVLRRPPQAARLFDLDHQQDVTALVETPGEGNRDGQFEVLIVNEHSRDVAADLGPLRKILEVGTPTKSS